MNLKSLLMVAFAALTAGTNSSHAESPLQLHVTTGFTPPVSDYFGQVMHELDQRLPQVQITFEPLPAERSLDLVNRGINDAECCRFPKVVMQKYPNLEPLQQSFHTVRFVAFSLNPELQIRNFDDLAPYTVGTVQGWRLAVREINRVAPRESLILDTPEQLMEMLRMKRIDVGVVGLLSGLEAAQQIGFKEVYAHQNPPLAAVPLVIMLHKKHQRHAALLDEELEKMRADGTIDRLQQAMMNNYR